MDDETTTNRNRRRFRGSIVAAAFVHLSIALGFASYQTQFLRIPLLGPAIAVYADASGANSNFNFFAPAVASQIRAKMILEEDGKIYTRYFVGRSREANLRLSTMFNSFVLPEAQPLLIRSWAAFALRTNPKARAVTIVVEIYDIPPLSAGPGHTGSWRELTRSRYAYD